MPNEILTVALSIYKNTVDFSTIPEKLISVIAMYKQVETNERISMRLPSDCDDLKNGIIVEFLKYFQESIYIGIAYLTDSDGAIVTDFDGKPIDQYDIIYNGKKIKEYVKKRIRIVKILNKETECFEVKEYILDFKFTNPIVKILDVYSVGKDSGLKLQHFLEE